MSNISLILRTKLSEDFYINSINIVKKLESHIDNTVKYLYELSDGNHVECVMMKYKHGNSLCISTQVGCKMGYIESKSDKIGLKSCLEVAGNLEIGHQNGIHPGHQPEDEEEAAQHHQGQIVLSFVFHIVLNYSIGTVRIGIKYCIGMCLEY